mgnify:FL=1
MNVLGIDIGGTSIVGGKIEDGRIVGQSKAGTRASEGGDVSLGVLKSVVAELVDGQTRAIGVGVPSVVDRKTGIVYNVQNIAGWDEVDIRGILEREFGLPVFVDNDANCFAFGEKIFGKGREFSNFVGVTLGTGVGSGIISAGRLLPDANCGSGEFGEVRIGGVKFDDWCGSHFFPDETGMSGAELSALARKGDAKALKAFEEYGRRLSELIKLIVLVLDPEAVIFGGSIAKSFDFFGDAIRANLADFPYPKSIEKLQILASDSNDSGVLGAASLCF